MNFSVGRETVDDPGHNDGVLASVLCCAGERLESCPDWLDARNILIEGGESRPRGKLDIVWMDDDGDSFGDSMSISETSHARPWIVLQEVGRRGGDHGVPVLVE